MAQRVRVALLNASPAAAVATPGDVVDFWRQELAAVAVDRPDLIVLPELCDLRAGASWDEYFDGAAERRRIVAEFFAEFAADQAAYVTYPSARAAGEGRWYNSVAVYDRAGRLCGRYDKRFPTIDELEIGFVPGGPAEPIECDFGRIGCLICFDLNFHELRQEYAARELDLLVFCSQFHGGLLLPQWAYECGAHLVGAVQALPSPVYSPLGRLLASTTNYHGAVTVDLNLDCQSVHLDGNRDKLRQLKRAYGPDAIVEDPGLLGSVLVTSNRSDRSASDLLREFSIEPTRDYLERSRQRCQGMLR